MYGVKHLVGTVLLVFAGASHLSASTLMRCSPRPVVARHVPPTAVAKAAASNCGKKVPRLSQPSSPPFLEVEQEECLRARSSKGAPPGEIMEVVGALRSRVRAERGVFRIMVGVMCVCKGPVGWCRTLAVCKVHLEARG